MPEELIAALQLLKEWIAQNEVMLESESLKFNVQPIDKEELEKIKSFTKDSLPESYYYFLSEIGSGQFFIGEYSPSFKIYNSAELEEYNSLVQQEIDEAEKTVHDQFIMIGANFSMGDWMGFCATENNKKNFDVYCHEYPIDEYVEISNELNSWRTFDEWIIKAIETKGKETL